MSFQSTGWVIDHSPTTGTDRLVLLALANYGGDLVERDGVAAWEAWPSVERIAFEAGLAKVDSARKSLRRLQADGHIEVIENGCPDERYPANKRPNLYRILTDSPRRCWSGCALCADLPPRGGASRGGAVGDPPPGGPGDPPPGGAVTPHGEGAKQLEEQPLEQPAGGHGAVAPVTAPLLKEQNHAALAKLPKGVDPEDVKALCVHLSTRSNRHHRSPGFVKVSPNWVVEMGRLLNSGPAEVEGYVPTPGEVHAVIDGIFNELNVRSSSGFCWADTIQSPGNLRKKWVRVTRDLAKRRQNHAPAEDVLAAMDQLDRMGVQK